LVSHAQFEFVGTVHFFLFLLYHVKQGKERRRIATRKATVLTQIRALSKALDHTGGLSHSGAGAISDVHHNTRGLGEAEREHSTTEKYLLTLE